MDSSLYLFENMGQIPDSFVLKADAALGLTKRKQRKTGKRKLLRTLLIAAVIAALMGVTAYAMGLLGLEIQHVGGDRRELDASRGEKDALSAALEERVAQFLLQLLDLRAHGRLGKAQLPGGHREIQHVLHREKGLQTDHVHSVRSSLNRIIRSILSN